MSTISSLGTDQSIFTSLQNLAAGQQGSQASQGSAASATAAASGESGSTQGVPEGRHHHHGGGKGGGLFSQVQSAVTSAPQSAQTSDSASDPNQVIQNAITQVLNSQQSGANGATTETTESSTDPDGTGGTDATGSRGTSSNAAFEQLLQSNGINAEQFQQDFRTAIHAVQNGGSADPSSVFSSFPPGSAVDTTG